MSKKKFRITIEYDGTSYHGWQRQENAITIQEMLETAIFQFCGQEVRVTGAGRTDQGVHARGQVAHFSIKTGLPPKKISAAINAHLPADIAVREVFEAPAGFHARYDARKRTYQYFISPEITAIHRKFCWQVFQKLNPDILNRAARLLVGEHDFGAFARMETAGKTKICNVFESFWSRKNGLWIYRISANRFLHGMVRGIVGTIVDTARGRFTFDQFEIIFNSGDRRRAGQAAPACGLFLEKVEYEKIVIN